MRQLVILFLFSLLVAPELANAHGGGLNAEGGHFNRKTGEYHCHREPCFSNQESRLNLQKPSGPSPVIGTLNQTILAMDFYPMEYLVKVTICYAEPLTQLALIVPTEVLHGWPIESALKYQIVQM